MTHNALYNCAFKFFRSVIFFYTHINAVHKIFLYITHNFNDIYSKSNTASYLKSIVSVCKTHEKNIGNTYILFLICFTTYSKLIKEIKSKR